MKSLRFGKLFDIELELHWTFVFLALFIVGALLLFQPQAFLPIIVLFFFLFLSVFLHELAHSLVAIQKGSSVKKIILLPIGGLSLTEDLPEKPKDEFLIAIAGPAFNFLAVFLILLIVSLLPLPFPWHLFSSAKISSAVVEEAIFSFPLFALLWINLILGAFNLFIPALPLDGGRVFRAILSLQFGFNKATQLAAKLSSFLAILLFIFGLFGGGLIIILIAGFIFLGAQQETQLVLVKETMHGVNFLKLIKKKTKILSGNLTVREAIEEMFSLQKTTFLVKKQNGFGIVSAEAFLEKTISLNALLETVAVDVSPVQKNISAEKLMEKFLVKGHPLLPVLDGKKFIGVIDFQELEDLYQLEKLQKASKVQIFPKKEMTVSKRKSKVFKKPKKK